MKGVDGVDGSDGAAGATGATGSQGIQGVEGDELAVAIKGPTVGRHIEELDEFYVDVPESHARRLKNIELDPKEQEIFEQLIKLHRKENHFWGR